VSGDDCRRSRLVFSHTRLLSVGIPPARPSRGRAAAVHAWAFMTRKRMIGGSARITRRWDDHRRPGWSAQARPGRCCPRGREAMGQRCRETESYETTSGAPIALIRCQLALSDNPGHNAPVEGLVTPARVRCPRAARTLGASRVPLAASNTGFSRMGLAVRCSHRVAPVPVALRRRAQGGRLGRWPG